MDLDEILTRRITGIRPFNQLPVDAEIWREAHQHHTIHRHLHAVAAHRPGIVYGLEVFASTSQARTITIAPGVGIDAEGQTVVLSEPVSFVIEEARQTYVILSFLRAADRASAVTVGGGQQYYREVEGRDLKQTKELPGAPYLELARLFRSAPDKPIRDAAVPFTPASDEINLLYRVTAFPHCYADMGIGELSYVPVTNDAPWSPNRAGLLNLLREANGQGFHLNFTGPMNLRGSAPNKSDPTLLYVAGRSSFQSLAEAEIEGLRRFLDQGGLLFGEASNDAFAKSFRELVAKIGAKLKDVPKGHPVLSAHHMFSAPPRGAQPNGTLQADLDLGILFSTSDYGAAWQGDIDPADAPEARSRIRDAQEFGLNIIALAHQRHRRRELSHLGS